MMDDHQQGEIARGLREGRVEAWRTLYGTYSRPVWQTVARWLGPGSADVADVVQETFLAAARSARGFDPERGSLWLWLVGIARKHAAIHFRRHGRQERVRQAADRLGEGSETVARWLGSRESPPADVAASAELATLVRAALCELPADYGALLTAKYLDGRASSSLPPSTGCRAVRSASKLARARRAFREVFGKVCPCFCAC